MPPRRVQRKPLYNDPQRAVAALTLGVVARTDKRNARIAEQSIRPTLLHFQVPIVGEAGNTTSWQTLSVDFDYHFHYSPGTQDTELEVPNYTWGAQFDGNPVLLSSHVSDYIKDPDNDNVVTGASVTVGAVAPGVEDLVPFTGALHMTFAGFASMFEDETEMTE